MSLTKEILLPISFAGNQKRLRLTVLNTTVSAMSPVLPLSFVRLGKVVPMKDKVISRGWHWTYGWLRRKDEDRAYGFCYEEADGDLIYTANPRHRDKVYLECREDSKTGERYLCFSTELIR